MGVLKAKVNGVWEDISGVTTHEVAIADSDPHVTGFRSATLWVDTRTDPPLLRFWDTQINPATWNVVVEPGLPLAGGTMDALAKIGFANETGDKINLYAQDFGLGVNASETVVYASGKVGFRDKGFDGALWAEINSSGLGPRNNYNFAFVNGWSNAGFNTSVQQFRVTPATVTVTSHECKGPAVGGNTSSRVSTYPAGVPAPWAKQSCVAFVNRPSYADGEQFTLVEARGDGIYCINSFPGGDWMLNFSMTWSR